MRNSTAWIPVSRRLPKCPRDSLALGTPVLIWPRNPVEFANINGFAYYGKRATGRPVFYIYGAEIHGVTYWQPMPKGPKK